MIRLKRFFLFSIGLAAWLGAQAQYDAQWSQYMQLPGLYNPGAIGLNSDLNVHLGFRQQWIGFENAPSTFSVNASMPLRTGKFLSGLGLIMTNESIGLFSTQLFQAQYAYKRNLWGGELSAGLQGGILQQGFNSGGIYIPDSEYHNPNDEAIPSGDIEGIIPDFSLGVWYNRSEFYAGLSASHLLGSNIKLKREESTEEDNEVLFKVARSYYLTGGYNINLSNPLYVLQPSILAKTDLVAWTADISCLLKYNKEYWGGLSWRPGEAMVAMVGVMFDFGLTVGYAYDVPISEMIYFTSGSHELFIAYRKKIDTSLISKKQKSIRIL